MEKDITKFVTNSQILYVVDLADLDLLHCRTIFNNLKFQYFWEIFKIKTKSRKLV